MAITACNRTTPTPFYQWCGTWTSGFSDSITMFISTLVSIYCAEKIWNTPRGRLMFITKEEMDNHSARLNMADIDNGIQSGM